MDCDTDYAAYTDYNMDSAWSRIQWIKSKLHGRWAASKYINSFQRYFTCFSVLQYGMNLEIGRSKCHLMYLFWTYARTVYMYFIDEF